MFLRKTSANTISKISWNNRMQGSSAVQISQMFLCFSESTTRCIFDYSSSLLSAHLSNLSGVKMFKHMLTVKHSSIKTHPNQLPEVFCGTVLAGAWSSCQENRSKLWFLGVFWWHPQYFHVYRPPWRQQLCCSTREGSEEAHKTPNSFLGEESLNRTALFGSEKRRPWEDETEVCKTERWEGLFKS